MDFLIGLSLIVVGIVLLAIGIKHSENKKATDISFSLSLKLIMSGIGVSIYGL